MTGNAELVNKSPGLVGSIPNERAFKLDRSVRVKKGKSGSDKIVPEWVAWVLPLSIIGLWLAATHLSWIKPYFIPKPEIMFSRFVEMVEKERFLNDFWISFHVMLIGYVLGVAIGFATGVSAGLSRTFDKAVSPTINVLRQIPALAWIPLFVLFLGISVTMKVVFLAKIVAIPLFLNTFQGIRSVSKEFIEVAQVFEYSSWKTLRKVILPAAFPSIFTGLRFSLGYSWGAVVFIEMLNGKNGVGWVLNDAMDLLDTPRLYVAIVVIGAIGLTLDSILGKIEKNLMKWKRQAL
jgi:sulfonate transport system permease protein